MRAVPLLVVALSLVSCYTRLNHPLIRQESRLFTPDPASDCFACHAGEPWLGELATGMPPGHPAATGDRWSAFREGQWWQAPGFPAQAPLASPPDGATVTTLPPPRPLVAGSVPAAPRTGTADGGIAPGADSVRRPPEAPRPRRFGRKPPKPDSPAPADSSRKQK